MNPNQLVYISEHDPMVKKLQKVPLRKGEMVIWNGGSVHCNFRNNDSKMRLIQFVRMLPNDPFCIERDKRAAPAMLSDPQVFFFLLFDFTFSLLGTVP